MVEVRRDADTDRYVLIVNHVSVAYIRGDTIRQAAQLATGESGGRAAGLPDLGIILEPYRHPR